MKTKRLMVNGIAVEFVTIAQLAEMSGKKGITLRKWIEKGWLPPANYVGNDVLLKDGTYRTGPNLYSLKFAPLLAEQIKKVKRGENANTDIELPEVRRQLTILMREEKQYYSQSKVIT